MKFTGAFLMFLVVASPSMFEAQTAVIQIDQPDPKEVCEECYFDEDINEDEDEGPVTYGMNEPFVIDGFEYTITEAYVNDSYEIDDYYIEQYGLVEDIVTIEVEYTNVFDSSLDEENYHIRPVLYADNYITNEYRYLGNYQDVSPGRSAKSRLVFNVPEDAEVLELEFESYSYRNPQIAVVEIELRE